VTLYILQAATPQSFHVQGCFAIDYDFADHRCYFFPVNVVQIYMNTPDDIPTTPNLAPAPFPLLLHCIMASGVPQPGSLGLRPNPTVVHVTLCEFVSFILQIYLETFLEFERLLHTQFGKLTLAKS